MGSKCAPSVACTFMGDFERIHIHSLPPDTPKPLIWLRFIDDIFAIWTDGIETLTDFTAWLNSRHPNIKFTCSHSDTSVSFLDTTVLLKDGQLETELFIKPTSSLSYLHRLSSHPSHVFQSLPYGEFLRVRRNCSNLESFDRFSETILEAFILWGYNRASLNRARDQARAIDRHTLLDSYANLQASSHTDANTSNTSSQDFYLILQHHDDNNQIKQLQRKNWSILETLPSPYIKADQFVEPAVTHNSEASWYDQVYHSILILEKLASPIIFARPPPANTITVSIPQGRSNPTPWRGTVLLNTQFAAKATT